MIINTAGNLLRRQAGFTLVEAMLAMVILSIAAAGVLLPFSGGATVRAEGIHSTLGSQLARDLVEQIVNTPFSQIITDFGNYSESTGHIISNFDTGAEFTDSMYSNFSRTAVCQSVYVPQEAGNTQAIFILATVQVKYKGHEIARIDRLIAK
jgi:prepilin-type N-terminal cleavage/methylation domain-containing protein